MYIFILTRTYTRTSGQKELAKNFLMSLSGVLHCRNKFFIFSICRRQVPLSTGRHVAHNKDKIVQLFTRKIVFKPLGTQIGSQEQYGKKLLARSRVLL